MQSILFKNVVVTEYSDVSNKISLTKPQVHREQTNVKSYSKSPLMTMGNNTPKNILSQRIEPNPLQSKQNSFCDTKETTNFNKRVQEKVINSNITSNGSMLMGMKPKSQSKLSAAKELLNKIIAPL